MAEKFFYALGGKQFGPISFDELKHVAVRGDLRRTDRIWSPGMKEWQCADSVAGLFADLPPDLEPEENDAKAAVASTPQDHAAKVNGIPYWLWLIIMALMVYWKWKHHQYAGQ